MIGRIHTDYIELSGRGYYGLSTAEPSLSFTAGRLQRCPSHCTLQQRERRLGPRVGNDGLLHGT